MRCVHVHCDEILLTLELDWPREREIGGATHVSGRIRLVHVPACIFEASISEMVEDELKDFGFTFRLASISASRPT